MNEVGQLTNEIQDIFLKYREKQNLAMINTVRQVKCCNCGHQARLKEARKRMLWFSRLTRFHHIIMAVVMIVVCLVTYLLGLVRFYNEMYSYGNRCCGFPPFWANYDCPVVF